MYYKYDEAIACLIQHYITSVTNLLWLFKFCLSYLSLLTVSATSQTSEITTMAAIQSPSVGVTSIFIQV